MLFNQTFGINDCRILNKERDRKDIGGRETETEKAYETGSLEALLKSGRV